MTWGIHRRKESTQYFLLPWLPKWVKMVKIWPKWIKVCLMASAEPGWMNMRYFLCLDEWGAEALVDWSWARWMYWLSLFSYVSWYVQFLENAHLFIRCSEHENQERCISLVTHTACRGMPHPFTLRGFERLVWDQFLIGEAGQCFKMFSSS